MDKTSLRKDVVYVNNITARPCKELCHTWQSRGTEWKKENT